MRNMRAYVLIGGGRLSVLGVLFSVRENITYVCHITLARIYCLYLEQAERGDNSPKYETSTESALDTRALSNTGKDPPTDRPKTVFAPGGFSGKLPAVGLIEFSVTIRMSELVGIEFSVTIRMSELIRIVCAWI
ncbi:hypothetical protein RRG08_010066 [Elysia crispata]|uniref:Uncharacterized protein n=1 Tax=Elysia crispata TaxID=231223 RepID=A0AAE1B9W1_9GAST|nr:hypothetical protein RRG08_010066 [Elysia crispata]